MIREYVTYINAAEKWDEAYEMLIKYKGGSKLIPFYLYEIYNIPYIDIHAAFNMPHIIWTI